MGNARDEAEEGLYVTETPFDLKTFRHNVIFSRIRGEKKRRLSIADSCSSCSTGPGHTVLNDQRRTPASDLLADRRLIDNPTPTPVRLSARDFGGDVAVAQAGGSERDIPVT